jgi:hypothetical protein
MYVYAQNYKCNKCEHEFQYGPHDTWNTPVLEQEEVTTRGIVSHSMPVCPKCWDKFLKNNLGLGYCTVDWGFGGSDYDKEMKNAAT